MITNGFHAEALMAGGYALFLAAVAAVLEWLARHSHRRSEQMRVAGFKYHQEFDRWICPTGQHLHRHSTDHHRQIVRYRAPGHVCNCCHKKPDCTDSEDGREIAHRPDSWVESELRRFHRGISLALLLLAGLILAAEVVRYNHVPDLLVLGGLLIAICALGMRLAWEFVAG